MAMKSAFHNINAIIKELSIFESDFKISYCNSTALFLKLSFAECPANIYVGRDYFDNPFSDPMKVQLLLLNIKESDYRKVNLNVNKQLHALSHQENIQLLYHDLFLNKDGLCYKQKISRITNGYNPYPLEPFIYE